MYVPIHINEANTNPTDADACPSSPHMQICSQISQSPVVNIMAGRPLTLLKKILKYNILKINFNFTDYVMCAF